MTHKKERSFVRFLEWIDRLLCQISLIMDRKKGVVENPNACLIIIELNKEQIAAAIPK